MSLRLYFAILLLPLISGCSSLHESFNVLSFEEDPDSGKAAQQYLLMSVVSDYQLNGGTTSPLKDYNDLLAVSDGELSQVLRKKCQPEALAKAPAGRTFLPPVFANIGIQAASILYNAAFDELARGAKKLQQRASPPPYSVRIAAGTGAGPKGLQWSKVKCIVIQRRLLPDVPKGFNAPVDKHRPFTSADKGLTIVLQRLRQGTHSSTLRPVYLRMDNAVAVTGAGEGGQAASVQATLAFTLSAVEVDKGKDVVQEVAKLTFPAFKLPIGRAAEACDLDDPLRACQYDSDLIRDPAKDADAISLAASVKEVGSPANAEERAKAGIDALKAISKPAFDAFIAEIKTAASGK